MLKWTLRECNFERQYKLLPVVRFVIHLLPNQFSYTFGMTVIGFIMYSNYKWIRRRSCLVLYEILKCDKINGYIPPTFI